MGTVHVGIIGDGAGNTSPESDTGFTLSGGVGGGSSHGNRPQRRFTLYGVNSTNYKDFLGNATYDSSASLSHVFGETYAVATAINAIRVIPTTGTITSGTVTCQPLPQ